MRAQTAFYVTYDKNKMICFFVDNQVFCHQNSFQKNPSGFDLLLSYDKIG